jgi:hypothetical protein
MSNEGNQGKRVVAPECPQGIYIETNDEVVEQLVGLIRDRLDLKLQLERLDEMMDDLAPRQ